MVIGLSGIQFSLYHTSDYRNRKTAQREPDLIITSMITDRIGRLEFLFSISQNDDKILEGK